MAKFLLKVKIMPEGLQGAIKEGFAAREAYVRQLSESQGIKIEAMYWAYGEDDLVVLLDGAPAAVLAMDMAIAASGAMRLATTPLITAAEMDEARARIPAFRPPGA